MESFHRHQKAALSAHDYRTQWVQRLPPTPLGIRSAFKDAVSCCSAELVYGTQLRLPADILEVRYPARSASDYIEKLRAVFRELRPPPTRTGRP